MRDKMESLSLTRRSHELPLYEYRCLKCKRHTDKIENLNGPKLKKCRTAAAKWNRSSPLRRSSSKAAAGTSPITDARRPAETPRNPKIRKRQKNRRNPTSPTNPRSLKSPRRPTPSRSPQRNPRRPPRQRKNNSRLNRSRRVNRITHRLVKSLVGRGFSRVIMSQKTERLYRLRKKS